MFSIEEADLQRNKASKPQLHDHDHSATVAHHAEATNSHAMMESVSIRISGVIPRKTALMDQMKPTAEEKLFLTKIPTNVPTNSSNVTMDPAYH
ncbi:UNVERIFIED_CONTAM: hypothetical protein NCL1_56743 [Trichonephila clavipes]